MTQQATMADLVAPPDAFTVLMVCTGNTGRSPMMEGLMRRAFATRGVDHQVLVVSAGTAAVAGTPIEVGAAKALGELGVDSVGSTATPLSADLLAAADLVLTATHEHSAEVVRRSPAAAARTFTLRELARTVGAVEAGGTARGGSPSAHRMRSAVAVASRTREPMPSTVPAHLDDLADAFGASDETYRRRLAEVAASVERIVPYLLGSPTAG